MVKYIIKLIFVSCVCTLIIQSAAANESNFSAFYRTSYNLRIISGGVNYYWKANHTMPSSIIELRDAGLLPTNMMNPVTDQALNLDPDYPEPGEFKFELINDQTIEITYVTPDGISSTATLDTSYYSDDHFNDANRRMSMYLGWVYSSFHTFYNEKGFVPGSIDDLINSGYWPFEGQLNPVTGMPLQFYSTELGDLNFTFGYKAQAGAYFSNGKVSVMSVSPETGIYYGD